MATKQEEKDQNYHEKCQTAAVVRATVVTGPIAVVAAASEQEKQDYY